MEQGRLSVGAVGVNRWWQAAAVCCALLLAGCGAPADSPTGLPAAQGMHLLADASLSYSVTAEGRLKVSYEVVLVNGGTAACNGVMTTVNWPPQLTGFLSDGNWDGGVIQPFTPGARGTPSGEYTFRAFPLPPRAQVEQWLRSTTLTVACQEPTYENTVTPAVRMAEEKEGARLR